MALQFIKFLKEAPAPRLSRPHSTAKPHNTGKPSSLRKMTFSQTLRILQTGMRTSVLRHYLLA